MPNFLGQSVGLGGSIQKAGVHGPTETADHMIHREPGVFGRIFHAEIGHGIHQGGIPAKEIGVHLRRPRPKWSKRLFYDKTIRMIWDILPLACIQFSETHTTVVRCKTYTCLL